MAKHAIRQFILARLVLGSAAAVLVALVVWAAVVAGGSGGHGEPLMVQPTADLQADEGSLPVTDPSTESATVTPSPAPSASGSTTPSASATASAPGSASASASVSGKPKPSKSVSRTPSAPPSRTTSPTPTRVVLTAAYSTSANWQDGFVAAVQVVNNDATARDWSVTLTYPSRAGVGVRGVWNATASVNGDTVTLRGTALAAGGTVNAGFQGAKNVGDAVKPVTCSVGGGTCRMS